jgi:hypothetical protein
MSSVLASVICLFLGSLAMQVHAFSRSQTSTAKTGFITDHRDMRTYVVDRYQTESGPIFAIWHRHDLRRSNQHVLDSEVTKWQ